MVYGPQINMLIEHLNQNARRFMENLCSLELSLLTNVVTEKTSIVASIHCQDAQQKICSGIARLSPHRLPVILPLRISLICLVFLFGVARTFQTKGTNRGQ
jgi:hypothetical protein